MLPVLCRIDHADSKPENGKGKLLLVVSSQPAPGRPFLGYAYHNTDDEAHPPYAVFDLLFEASNNNERYDSRSHKTLDSVSSR